MNWEVMTELGSGMTDGKWDEQIGSGLSELGSGMDELGIGKWE